MDLARKQKRQITKFGMYGLFKNLKFFDPFLFYYLIQNGISYTQIGLLYAIRETVIYVLEIPSGVFADRYGKKTELLICFVFYMISFVFLFIGNSFFIFAFAYLLFGLGEAFRSGTHKAMIMQYLEDEKIQTNKTKIYGYTRSYSMIGSSISALFSILLVIVLPDLRLLFLVSILPYIADFMLVITYPNSLNKRQETNFTFLGFLREISLSIFDTLRLKHVRVLLLDSATYNGVFKTIKDYIQPILELYFAGIILFVVYDATTNLEIVIGLVYAIIYFISSIASKYSYLLLNFKNRDTILQIIWLITSLVFLLLFVYIEAHLIVIASFVLIYVLQNLRKPIMVGKIGDHTDTFKRATVLSVESQLTSLFIIVFAPLFGLVFDNFGVSYVFLFLAGLSLLFWVIGQIVYRSLKQKD
jgi:MFS family permease